MELQSEIEFKTRSPGGSIRDVEHHKRELLPGDLRVQVAKKLMSTANRNSGSDPQNVTHSPVPSVRPLEITLTVK